jgi:KipI family sensor histidine kinase inhibitor
MPKAAFRPAGDRAIVASFGDEISEELNVAVMALDRSLAENPIEGVIETVPTYRSLLVYYDPAKLRNRSLARELDRRSRLVPTGAARVGRTIEIPVRYGGAYGEDLGDVALHCGLSEAEVIERHSGREYRIYMLGFLPGFAYLGNMDLSLATPRMGTPRQAIPAGSVGIGGEQTGIYPLVSPGGWRIIGRTPLRLYDPRREEPIPYRPGDFIRFRSVGDDEFEAIKARVDSESNEGASP